MNSGPFMLFDYAALGIVVLGFFFGIGLGIRRQLINSVLIYAAIILAFQWHQSFNQILSLIFLEVGPLTLLGFALVGVGIVVYITLFALCQWLYWDLVPSGQGCFDNLMGGIVGVFQGSAIVVFLGIAMNPIVSFLIANDLMGLALQVQLARTWNLMPYAMSILIPLIKFWLPGVPSIMELWM